MTCLIWLPMRSWYHNDSNKAVTQNLGTIGPATLGDGTITTTFPARINEHGMKFDGGDYLQFANAVVPDVGNVFTIACLVKNPGTGWQTIVNKTGSLSAKNSPYILDVFNSSYYGYIGNGITSLSIIIAGIKDQTEFVAFTCDESYLRLYLNGVAATPVLRTINAVNNANALLIGSAGATGYLTGNIYALAMYNTTLSPAQLAILETRMRGTKTW